MQVTKEDSEANTGVRGWLLFLCVYLRAIRPTFVVLGTLAAYPYLRGDEGVWSILFIITGSIIAAIYSYLAGTDLMRIAAGARRRAEITIQAIIVFEIIAPFFLLWTVGNSTVDHVGMAVGYAIGGAIVPIGCFFYLKRSRRVANTYRETSNGNSSSVGDGGANYFMVWLGASLNGWQRLWVVFVGASFVGIAIWIFVSSKDVDIFEATCIPEKFLQIKVITIPPEMDSALPSGMTYHLEAAIPDDMAVKFLELKHPALKGQLSALVQMQKIILSQDALTDNYLLRCPTGLLRPRPDVQSKYAKAISEAQGEVFAKNLKKKAGIALASWLVLATFLYLAGMLIGWVINGFKRR